MSSPQLPATAQSAKSAQTLFRSQAVIARGMAIDGRVQITRPLATSLLTLFIFAITAIALTFILYGEYARKETVSGYLEPEQGVIRIVTPHSGVMSELRVVEGDSVARDAVLFNVQRPQTLGDGSDSARKQLATLSAAHAALSDARTREAGRAASTEHALSIQAVSLREQREELLTLQQLQQQQIRLADVQLQRLATLHARRGVPEIQWLSIRAEHLAGREKLQATRSRLRATDGELATLQANLAALQYETAERSAALDAEALGLQRSVVAIEATRDFAVRAPVAGRVMTLQRKIGEALNPGEPVLTILPERSPLVARLLIPTRAIGFVATGQTVRLRYDAFPYQHFGTQPGVLRAVASSVLFSGEAYGPLLVNQPAYPATVAIAQQSIDAPGRVVPLQAGMLLQAEIILERRSIAQWLAEPLFALRGHR